MHIWMLNIQQCIYAYIFWLVPSYLFVYLWVIHTKRLMPYTGAYGAACIHQIWKQLHYIPLETHIGVAFTFGEFGKWYLCQNQSLGRSSTKRYLISLQWWTLKLQKCIINVHPIRYIYIYIKCVYERSIFMGRSCSFGNSNKNLDPTVIANDCSAINR